MALHLSSVKQWLKFLWSLIHRFFPPTQPTPVSSWWVLYYLMRERNLNMVTSNSTLYRHHLKVGNYIISLPFLIFKELTPQSIIVALLMLLLYCSLSLSSRLHITEKWLFKDSITLLVSIAWRVRARCFRKLLTLWNSA